MRSNVDKNLDRLRRQFWRNMLVTILTCQLASLAVGICKSSVVAAALTYILLSCIGTVLVGYRLWLETARELEGS